MKTILTAAALLALCFPVIAQTEYGSPEELKGVKKIFVDTGDDMEVRENILKELGKSKKKLPDLEVVSRAEDAEIVLSYGGSSDTYLAGVEAAQTGDTTATGTATYRTVTHGKGLVFKPLGGNKIRLLMSFKDSRSSRFERRPSTNFAREFIRAYTKANGVK